MNKIVEKILLGLTDQDSYNLALTMDLYPQPATRTDAIRVALASHIANADPVALAAAKKAVSKKEKGATQ